MPPCTMLSDNSAFGSCLRAKLHSALLLKTTLIDYLHHATQSSIIIADNTIPALTEYPHP